jgi:cytochrome c biogenesis protein CcmG/thiol:disulfide interchange protein DsbE
MSPTRRRLLRLAPLGAFAIAGSAAWVLVERRLGEREEPVTVALTQTLPRFSLPGLSLAGLSLPNLTGDGFTAADLDSAGTPVLLNFFASWCVPCVLESPTLLTLRDSGLAIWGIAYKDKQEATAAFLRDYGNPYVRLGIDPNGAVSAGFGLSGVPETFLVDRGGAIRWRWAGALTENIVSGNLQPILRSLG